MLGFATITNHFKLEPWLRISLQLCSFGFFREMRPSDPYIIEYLIKQYNSTSEEINKNVYPIVTYAQLTQLVIIFLVTDMLRYKPIIIVAACAGLIGYGLNIWTDKLIVLQITQCFFGTLMACDVAYYTYIYAKVDKDRYQIVTGYARAAILCGKFLGGTLGQLLLSTGTTNKRGLLYITFSSQAVSLLIAIALPKVGKSIYFHTDQKKIDANIKSDSQDAAADTSSITSASDSIKTKEHEKTAQTQFSWHHASRLLLQQIKSAYSKPIVIQWSIWWALATSAQVQIITYIQFLWLEIDPHHENFYNGAVEATITLLGAAAAMAAGLMNGSRHKKWHWLTITIGSLIMGLFIITAAISSSIILSYIMYVLFGGIYFFLITIATATVAENISDDSFGLIFGVNALTALVLQALITVGVISDIGLGYAVREQYLVFGLCFVVLAVLYCLFGIMKFVVKYRREHGSHYMA